MVVESDIYFFRTVARAVPCTPSWEAITPTVLLRIVVCRDSWDGAHGVTRPTFAICKYFPVCCDSSVFSAGRDARFYGGQDARLHEGRPPDYLALSTTSILMGMLVGTSSRPNWSSIARFNKVKFG